MSSPRLYKHVNNTDVALEVIKSFYVKEKSLWKLKVRWYNIVHRPTSLGIVEKIQIPRDKWRDEWKLLDT